MKGKVPVQDAWASRVSLPPPPGAAGGEVGWRARSCLGILSREGGSLASHYRELESRLFLASKIRGWSRTLIRQVAEADYFGGLFWRALPAN
jgi:hypothetical protein